ncbi:hypothetical protein F7725_023387 [Dissostichus mawsoni]|uniref:Uncharacterized protein n=1 Tax=Dissostichus mawsoni TaxID=36200 RepID=A0A7J5Z0J7_DISMA|nr:hypothetical protein F7725_023387 [Dissostichus mawsoni]
MLLQVNTSTVPNSTSTSSSSSFSSLLLFLPLRRLTRAGISCISNVRSPPQEPHFGTCMFSGGCEMKRAQNLLRTERDLLHEARENGVSVSGFRLLVFLLTSTSIFLLHLPCGNPLPPLVFPQKLLSVMQLVFLPEKLRFLHHADEERAEFGNVFLRNVLVGFERGSVPLRVQIPVTQTQQNHLHLTRVTPEVRGTAGSAIKTTPCAEGGSSQQTIKTPLLVKF